MKPPSSPLSRTPRTAGLITILLTALLVYTGCGRADMEKKVMYDSMAMPTAPPPTEQAEASKLPEPAAMLSLATRITQLDSSMRFLREGQIRFRVNDVAQATYRVEALTQQLGGYVENTELVSQSTHSSATRISKDSVLETTHYQVTNQLLVRIPAVRLDSFMRGLVPLAQHLDRRRLSCRNITLDLLAEELARKRNQTHAAAVQQNIADAPGSKLAAKTDAQQSALSSATAADEALLEKLRLEDKVQYSTLTLEIYQPDVVQHRFSPFKTAPEVWQPAPAERFAKSLAYGWKGLLEVLYVIALLWPLWLACAAALFVYNRIRAKKKSAAV